MERELQKHKTSDRVKWILTLLAFILVGVILTGIILGWFEKKKVPDNTEEANTQLNDGLIVAPSESNGLISLTAMPLANEETTPKTADSYTLNAVVSPQNADNKLVDWAIKWTKSDGWASGKTVTDYVTVTPTSNGSLTAHLDCKRAFAAQITVTVSSRHNPEIKASTTVEYRERVTGVNFVFSTDDKDYVLSENMSMPYLDELTFRTEITKSEGTIPAEFSVSATMGLAEDLAYEIEYSYGNHWGTGFNTRVPVTEYFDMISEFDTCLTPDVYGQYIDSDYTAELYAELMDFIKRLDCNAVDFKITLTNTATGTKTEYTYAVPFDKETMLIYIGNLSLNGPVIF